MMPGSSNRIKPTADISPGRQRFLLRQAKGAGAAGDDDAMIKLVTESQILAGLHRRLTAKISARSGSRCDEDDVDDALDLAVTSLFSALSSGQLINDIGSYLFRVAERRTVDLYRHRRKTPARDPATISPEAGEDRSVLHKLAREEDLKNSDFDAEASAAARKRSGLKTVRRLLPEMKLARSKQVIEYILDALEQGAAEVTDQHVAEALGLTSEAVRKARERGFARLKKLAIKHGYSTGALDCIPDRSNDNEDET